MLRDFGRETESQSKALSLEHAALSPSTGQDSIKQTYLEFRSHRHFHDSKETTPMQEQIRRQNTEAHTHASTMVDVQLQGGHGGQGSQESSFSRLLKKDQDYKPLTLSDPDKVIGIIAHAIDQGPDTANDLPDEQENPFVPAAYTYFGQFVDHDLTFDTRSTLQTITSGLSSFPDDERTPRLDMDCLYGLGPSSAPYMYDEDGRLAANPDKPFDLPRSAIRFKPDDPASHRAIIGDPRNDENSIVCQLQLAFIQFHNAMIAHFKQQGLAGATLFRTAQREVRFTYQMIVVTGAFEFEDEAARHAAGNGTVRVVGSTGSLDRPTWWQRKNLPRIAEEYRRRIEVLDGLLAGEEPRVLLTHYPPTYVTMGGEKEEWRPELGCKAMEPILLRRRPTFVIHGHIHKGVPEGALRPRFDRLDDFDKDVDSIPVHNVAYPVRHAIATFDL